MENIFSFTKNDLIKKFESDGKKKFMASQVFDWLYDKKVYNFDEFTNIKKENIEYLKDNFTTDFIKIIKVEEDTDVKKFLFALADNQKIEAVLMMHNYGLSVCVSSQVGCNMGCKFCESGRLKKIRNLETYEMVQQIILISKYIKQRIDSCVIMGIGEPFDNYDNVIKFLRVVNYPKGLEIGARHITVSTCGIVPKIYEFAEFELQVNLAISLHAPNDALRSEIMKINKAYKIEEVMNAVKYYIQKTNRRVTFEYILLRDVNDSEACAKELARLIKGINAYVNLIPYNEVITKPYKKVTKEKAEAFYHILDTNHIQATLRMEHGADIDAACGQLRAKKIEVEHE